MARIAIIDDAINEEFLKRKSVKERIVIYNESPENVARGATNSCTHATICALILEECADNYEIISIQIMKDCDTPTNIDNLVRALQICLELQIDIISMSIGTVRLSESLKMNEVMESLVSKNVIMVAALSNKSLITLPAFYHEVIGVQCDFKSVMKPLEIAVYQENCLGAQVTANCEFDFSKLNISYLPSNSFSVPVVVAYINSYLNVYRKEKHILKLKRNNSIENCYQDLPGQKEVLRFLEKHSSKKGEIKEKKNWKKYERILKKASHTIPHVCMIVSNEMNEKDIKLGKDIINSLYFNDCIETIGFQRNRNIKDIRFFSLERNCITIDEVEPFLEIYSEAELIFSVLTKMDYQEFNQSIEPDLVIYLKNNQTEFEGNHRKLCVLDGKEKREARSIGKTIVELLS